MHAYMHISGVSICTFVLVKYIYMHIAGVSICTFTLVVKQVNRVESDDEEDESSGKRYTVFSYHTLVHCRTRNSLAFLVQNLGKSAATQFTSFTRTKVPMLTTAECLRQEHEMQVLAVC